MNKELLSSLSMKALGKRQRSPEYLEWINSDLIGITEEYVCENNMTDSAFIETMNSAFKTDRFVLLLKRWLVEYLFALFGVIDDHVQVNKTLALADIRINRFAIEKYVLRFDNKPCISWERRPGIMSKLFDLAAFPLIIVFLSLSNGLRLSRRKRSFKVMREALWGLKDIGGYYFHDDFFIDNEKIKNDDLLLFSRGVPTETGRLKGYRDARESDYSHFVLGDLPLGIDRLAGILRRYILLPVYGLFRAKKDDNYSVYFAILMYFAYHALNYEKVFSNYDVGCELGHNYFSPSHIAEAIVCQHDGARHYLFHWSDNSIKINSYISSFLGCDKYLIWGSKHIRGVEGEAGKFLPTGYIFKRFINQVTSDKESVLSALGITAMGKIITFFDETFGGNCKMTADHYVVFWRTALELAQKEPNHTIVMKPKEIERYHGLPEKQKSEFLEIKDKLEKMQNVYIAHSDKWSFIEYVGISDVVVTQGMTSSATIALICGKEGLYLDQAGYDHPFSKIFKDILVFDDQKKLIAMLHKTILGQESPLKYIQEGLIREYDKYADDRGIDVLRDVLSGDPMTHKRVGIIVQARMGSTRLPGKVMLPIENKPVLQHIIERLKDCQVANEIVIATTKGFQDDPVVDLARTNKVKYYRGSEENVLSRFYHAAKKNSFDVIVRITADCPLVDPEMIDAMLNEYFRCDVDYLSNSLSRSFPRGLDIEIFSSSALNKAYKSAQLPYQKEHVTPYIYENPSNFRLKNYSAAGDFSQIRVTLDTSHDLELIKKIYGCLYAEKPKFRSPDVLEIFEKNPEYLKINSMVKQKILCE
ncbi:cytidylyltransferase domain-containing protein [Candidatus Margulisiibacteriota bacterium]